MSRAVLALVVTVAGVTSIATHHHKRPVLSAAPAVLPGTVLVREPVPPRRPTPVRASRRHPRPSLRILSGLGEYADTTMYCATGNQNSAGRWPQLGDVAVLNRSIPFGSRVVIDGNVYRVEDWVGHGTDFDIYGGSDPECEQRALDYGRRHLRVVIER